MSCFWDGSIETFLGVQDREILSELEIQHSNILCQPASIEQIRAWKSCLSVLKKAMINVPSNLGLIFEFVLPRERGRRPDIIILSSKQALVLEFKDFGVRKSAHVDQVAAYARDLADYHKGSRDLTVVPILVLTKAEGLLEEVSDVTICGPDRLSECLRHLLEETDDAADIQAFIDADYEPLPSLVNAARILFKHEPLPQIYRAESVGIPETIKYLHELADEAISQNKNILALVTGVPGSGKSLVGLQFVYDRSTDGESNAVFLSGNGPLVEVFQYTLKNRIFVQDVHGFLKQYGGNSSRLPKENIWIYDEAQRAWDDQRSKEKRGPSAVSEPYDFLRLGARTSGGTLIIGLIGEGQEIHLGEEAGISQWNDAICEESGSWVVACPKHVEQIFNAADHCYADDRLNLDNSLRTHRATDLQSWVKHLLDGKIDKSRQLCFHLKRDGFPIYVTRSLESAKRHAQERYRGFEDKRYGLLASSKAKNLERNGVYNGFVATRKVKKGPWFSDDPSSLLSCCRLDSVATEFACQGLELDFPIVAWGNDLVWTEEGTWISKTGRSNAKDPHQLRINSYRVLLTRGRDGMVIYVPNEAEMTTSYETLIHAGASTF